MENKTTLRPGALEKRNSETLIKIITICMLLLTGAALCSAQTRMAPESPFSEAYRNEQFIPERDKAAKITAFNAVYSNKKTHLSWAVKNQLKQGTYIIERSEDGAHFEIIGVEKGVPTKKRRSGLFFFTDESAEQVKTYYRIKHLANDNSVLVSEKILPVNASRGRVKLEDAFTIYGGK